MEKDLLGQFEQQVLLAALRLGNDAYSAQIVRELERCIERQVAPAAVYITLRRLEDGGYVESSVGVREGHGGVRERRYFAVTGTGMTVVRQARHRMMRLWDGLEPMLEAP